VNLSNARLGYEPHRDDGDLCVYFKDKREAVGFAEAILQEVQNIENGNLPVSDCSLITIRFSEEQSRQTWKALRELFPDRDREIFISVPDRS
jgi:hypothetical protein